jgi:hypothetical protein
LWPVDFLSFWLFLVLKHHKKSICKLCAYSDLYVYTEHMHQELMHALIIRIWNLRMHKDYTAGTYECIVHRHQVLMRSLWKGPSKHAEHAQKKLMHALSIHIRSFKEHKHEKCSGSNFEICAFL